MEDNSNVIQFKKIDKNLDKNPNKDTYDNKNTYERKFVGMMNVINNPNNTPNEKHEVIRYYLQEIPYIKECSEEQITQLINWTKELYKVYKNFLVRNSPDKWEALLSTEVCHGEPTKSVAIHLILIFIYYNINISSKVINSINKKLELTDRIASLRNYFDNEFIDLILIKLIDNVEFPEYDKFTPISEKLNYDNYLVIFRRLNYAIQQNKHTLIKKELYNLRNTGIDHPMTEFLEIRALMISNDFDDAKRKIQQAEIKYKDMIDEGLVLFEDLKANIFYREDKFENTVICCKKVIDKEPNNFDIAKLLASAYINLQDYSAAKEVLDDFANKGYANDHSEAILCLIYQYITPDKTLPELYHQRALKHLSTNNNEKALSEINSALEILPQNPYFKRTKLKILQNLGKNDEVLELCKELLLKTSSIDIINIKKQLEDEKNKK